ncbi:MAG: flagellar biosynthetic protein FliR [Pirellulaceae bacterium]
MDISLHDIVNFLLILARVSAVVGFFPLFGRRQIPMMVKAGMAGSLSFFWFSTMRTPIVGPEISVPEISSALAVLLVAKEMGIGLLIAMLLGFMLVPAKIAGQYVGQELGLSMAAISDPSSPDSSGEVGQLFETLAIFLFFGLNLHHFVLLFLDVTFNELGGKIDLLRLPTEQLVAVAQHLDDYGLLVAAPLGIVLFLLNLGLVYLNKAAPTMNLFSVGMAIRGSIGMVCMLVFLPFILQAISVYFYRVEGDIEQAFALFQYY